MYGEFNIVSCSILSDNNSNNSSSSNIACTEDANVNADDGDTLEEKRGARSKIHQFDQHKLNAFFSLCTH